MGRRQRRSKAAPQQPAVELSAQPCLDEKQDASAGGPTKIDEMLTVVELVGEVTAENKRLKQELHASEQAKAQLQEEAATKVEELRRASELADSVQAERDELKQQLDRQRLEQEASEQAKARLQEEAAAKVEELRRASELADAVQAERDELKRQLDRQRLESEASEQVKARLQEEAAAKSEELRRASELAKSAQAERDDLKQQLIEASARSAGSSSGQAGFRGAEWYFESDLGEWTSLPANSSADLLRSYQAFSKGGKAIVHMRSGVEEYSFDFQAMSQTNKRTGKSRKIKCQLHAPSNWTRRTSLECVCDASEAESFELSGFHDWAVCFHGTYVLSDFHKIYGRKTWWHVLGSAAIYKTSEGIFLVHLSSYYADDRSKLERGECISWAGCLDAASPYHAKKGWRTWIAEEWQECKTAQVAPVGRSSISPLMEIAVEFLDGTTLERFAELLRNSTTHATQHHGASSCTSFKDTVEVVRVLRIENWHLWTKYQSHLEHVRQDLSKLGLTLAAIEPALPAALRKLPPQCGSLDEKVGEYMLFHGTDYETAVKIANEGFDFRLSKPGYYGQGTYFASQACKSHQYTKDFYGLRTIILSRVIVGDVAYATKVDKECKRPPPRAGTSRCCDTVVAMPGHMPGHRAGEQTHQEFVVFDKYQAYPEFIVQYWCAA